MSCNLLDPLAALQQAGFTQALVAFDCSPSFYSDIAGFTRNLAGALHPKAMPFKPTASQHAVAGYPTMFFLGQVA